MSAWMCSKAHIEAIIRNAISLGIQIVAPASHPDIDATGDGWVVLRASEDADEMADILYLQNVRSLEARYGHEQVRELVGYELPGVWNFAPKFPKNPILYELSPVELLTLCQCYDYQACETGFDYCATPAARIVAAVRDATIRLLPGYDTAKWGI